MAMPVAKERSMEPDSLALLCDPDSHEALEFQPDALVNTRSGKRYPLRDGIPDFAAVVSGDNKKYEELYDRIAFLYDLSEALYRWLKHRQHFRKVFLDELEVRPGLRILEVSVGTGANVPYFPLEAAYFGLDLSWGMLRKCRRNLRKWKRVAELFRGEAEHLPFRDEVFDVVFHVGGINFFNDKAGAIREMIRVARPGTKILIVDETEKVVQKQYEKTPLVGRYYKHRAEAVTDPANLVPVEMQEVQCKEILGRKAYCLTFRKP
jgi:ubiquinone/menaquinone biosynthesis C-methylase UbiE/uncharacterized protein YbaR (Trm112 family)